MQLVISVSWAIRQKLLRELQGSVNMGRRTIILSVVVLALGNSSSADRVAARDWHRKSVAMQVDDKRQHEMTEFTRTLGTYRYYGYREYRCRKFSSVCGYYRPVYYGHYWSIQHRIRNAEVIRPNPPARLGYYRHGVAMADAGPGANSGTSDGYLPASQTTAAPAYFGAFTRIKAPGRATRWVHADALTETK